MLALRWPSLVVAVVACAAAASCRAQTSVDEPWVPSASPSAQSLAAEVEPAGSWHTATGSVSTLSVEAPAQPSVCAGIEGQPLIPPTSCDGPRGHTATERPTNGLYATSWFGCYRADDGTVVKDPYDNCEFACGSRGLCPAGQDGPTCEANLRWFAADADRYGCGGRIRVTNCENGKAVVLVTLDRGPHCESVEKSCAAPVLDMSHDAMVHLFDGKTYGGSDHQRVVVEAVDSAIPLGPV